MQAECDVGELGMSNSNISTILCATRRSESLQARRCAGQKLCRQEVRDSQHVLGRSAHLNQNALQWGSCGSLHT